MTLQAIEENEPEISPSTIFAVASVLEGSMYINGSPQNTFVPGVIELAERRAPSRLPPHCLPSQSPSQCCIATFARTVTCAAALFTVAVTAALPSQCRAHAHTHAHAPYHALQAQRHDRRRYIAVTLPLHYRYIYRYRRLPTALSRA